MGKSYKKTPIYTDNNSSKIGKQISHRKFRSKTKQLMNQGKFDILPEDERELTDSYDIHDFKIRFDKDDQDYMKEIGYSEDEVKEEVDKAKRK